LRRGRRFQAPSLPGPDMEALRPNN
jgi:hypothetical protein